MINLNEIKQLKSEIIRTVEEENMNNALELISNYEKYISDIDVIVMKSIIQFNMGNLADAEETLISVYNKFEFNFEVNYNLGMINICQNKINNGLNYLIKAMTLDSSKKDMVSDIIKNLLEDKKVLNQFECIRKKAINELENYSKFFPENYNGGNLIGECISNKSERFYCGICDNYVAKRDEIFLESIANGHNLFKTEVLRGKKIKSKKVICNKKTILPIMKFPNSELEFKIGKNVYNLSENLPYRYYYYLINPGEELFINSDEFFVLGDFIELEIDNYKPKVVLNLFVDGLTQEMLKKSHLKEYMPNTYKFFQDGTICNNTYVTGEWTYVSVASIFTGMYTTNHRVYHPIYDTKNLFKHELYTEVFNRNNYFCSKIDGNWRTTPTLGYIKGMDRTIYQSNVRGMYSKDIVTEVIENLEMFKEKNNFLWTCLFDLHDISDELEVDVVSQSRCLLSNRFENSTDETSVRKEYNTKKLEKYKIKLRSMDIYLGMLFSFIKENYSEDEYIVSLFSDHGQGYLAENQEFLGAYRTKIPFMIRGKGVKKGECNEMISSLDIFPTILNLSGISDFDIKDGNIPKYFGGEKEREYTITESIFPESTYKAVINDLIHEFFFETEGSCTQDGRISIEKYKVKLINKKTKEDETNLYNDKVLKYKDIVLEHIEDYILVE